MGGGDLNAKKAWHPSTLKNQERVWKAEQAAAEENKRIVELERERHLERERAELNKLAKSNLTHSTLAGDDRLHWMYEKPDKKVQQEEYLLGKAIEKNHGQAGKSEAEEIPAVSRRVVGLSMLTVADDTQVDLARKIREDPLLLVKERERAARAALLNNPVQRARLTELLRKEQESKNESKSKKKKKKGKDLDNILAEKLQALGAKKGIDLASLLASDDSSSESSDGKSKKKKKKKEKKIKNVIKRDNSLEENIHKPKNNTKTESKRFSGSDKKKRTTSASDEDVCTKKKKRHHSDADGSINSRVKESHRDSSVDQQSSDDQQRREDRYWNNKHYSSTYRQSRADQSSREERRTKDHKNDRGERHSKTEQYSKGDVYREEFRQRDVGSSRSNRNSQNDHKNKKDRETFGNASSSSDKGRRSKKSSGLSEEEKAAKLAEMVAAGAERETQRERRVAVQLAEKEKEDRPTNAQSRARNVVRQLPDSLESRLHSNRHYIQRDQRHMNENFARR